MKKINIFYRTYQGETPPRLAVQTFSLDDKKDSLEVSIGSRRAQLVKFNNIDDYDHFELIFEFEDIKENAV